MKIRIHKEKLDKLVRLRNMLIGLVIFLVIVIFFFLLNILNANKINWGTKVAGISIGGLSLDEAQEKLIRASEDLLKKDLNLNYKNYQWSANPKNLGAIMDIPATINRIFESQHQKNNFISNAWQQFYCLFGCNLRLTWEINEEEMEKFFKDNLFSIHQPAQNSTLVYDEKKQDFVITPSKNGVIIDKIRFENDLTKIINGSGLKNIQITLIKDRPEVSESETQEAHIKAKNILLAVPFKLFVTGDEKEIAEIDKEKILSLIEFKPVIDLKNPDNKILGIKLNLEKTKDYLISLAPSINREPVDAQFTFQNNRVTAFVLSEDGVRLEIENNFPVLEKGILNPPNNKEIQLKTSVIKPKITSESINNLGITTLLARGTSNFSGSPNNRVHNIKVGAARFNGILIKSEEEFSFNANLGEVGPEQGYEPELVIKKDKTIPEYGGGLCQVSTTLFRAAINSGLKITERYPHAFPVKYYNPQGFDATIYPPSPDLKFINNTPGYILIQAKIINQDLSFELYGTNDNRKVVIEGPTQYDVKEDGSMKAKLVQKVYNKEGNLLIDKTFNSTYQSPNLYPVERNPLE